MDRYAKYMGGGYFENMGSCNVTLFLALSGYGLTASWKSDSDMNNYWRNKLEKIYFPYALITILWMFVFFTKPLSGKIVFFNVLCININNGLVLDSTMWFLTFLWLWYIFFYWIMLKKIATYFKVFCFWMIGFVASSMWNVPEEIAWFAQVVRWSAFGFPLGVTGYFIMEKINVLFRKKWLESIWWGIIGIIALAVFHYMYYTYIFTDCIYEVTGILWTVGVVGIFHLVPTQKEFWKFPINIKRVIVILPYMIYLLENKVLQYAIRNQFNLGVYLIYLVAVACVMGMLVGSFQQAKH